MPLHGQHDLTLVALSYVVAVVASFGALTLAERITKARGVSRTAWLAGGALTMGLGIWGMHFVGMLAFRLPVPVGYDLPVVFLSGVPAVVASGLALWIVSGGVIRRGTYAWASVAMGAAIAGMHYLGMEALVTEAELTYRAPWVVASLAVAVFASFAALWLSFRLRTGVTLRAQGLRLLAATVMGAAIAGMHYTGMVAAVFEMPAGSAAGGVLYAAASDIVLGVSGGVIFVVFLALALAFLERRSPQPALFQLGVLMIVVPLAVGAVTMVVLYRDVVDRETRLVAGMAERQNRALVGMVRMHAAAGPITGLTRDFRESLAAVLSEAVRTSGAGGTFEIVAFEGDSARFLIEPDRDAPLDAPSVPQAFRLAAGGGQGTLVTREPDGSETLFAYQGLDDLGLAVVTSVPVPEIRAPFVRAALFSAALAMLLVLAGVVLFVQVGSPLVARAEEGDFLDSVLEYAPASWVVEDPDRGIVRVNSTFEATFGTPARRMEGRRRDQLGLQEELLWLFDEMEQEARATGRAVREFDFPTGDGRVVPVRGTVGVAQGLSRGSLFWVLEDISDRRAVREALEEGRRRAEEASRAKSAFLASMSHEIRTPMNGVMGMLELLLDTELTREQREIAEIASGSAESLLELLNSVLDFSKIEAGALTLEEIPMDLESTVHEAVRALKIQALDRGNELTLEVDDGVPRTLLGDPLRIRQIVTNLVGNAIKFTENGEIRVSLRPASDAESFVDVALTVADTGEGIAPDKLERVFGEFEQAESSTTRMYGGTGLGLAISRRLAHLMDGDISVESEPGAGTRFTVHMRLRRAPEGASVPRNTESASLEGKRFLVIDDSATARRISREAIQGAGGSVHEAERGLTGFDVLLAATRTRDPFDVVVIDSLMPDLGGFELAHKIHGHEELRGTRMLMLTSGSEGDGHVRARENGINGYLSKPTKRRDLVLALSNVLTHRGPGEGPERRVVTEASLAGLRSGLRILLAEDSEVNRRVAVSMLEKRGHVVDVAHDGVQAVEAVRRGDYDVILMDLQMPNMGGIEAAGRIRSEPGGGDVPIIALTAHALDEERERSMAAGMTGFLTKPYRADDLYAAVEQWADAETARAGEPAGTSSTDAVDLEGFRRSLVDSGIGEVLRPTLRAWAEETPGRLAALEGAASEGALAEMARIAHAMKSAAGTVHAHGLASSLSELEEAAGAGEAERAAGLVASAAAETRAALEQIARFLDAGDDDT